MNSSTKDDGGVKKFMFDTNDFDKPDPVEPTRPLFTEEQMTLAREQGFADGRAAGQKETRAAQEEQIAQMLQSISAQAEKLVASEDRRDLESMIDATKLAMRITHKLMPQFAQRFSLEEIQRVILDSVDVRKDEARIAVMVPPVHMDALRARIDDVALGKGYAGKLILVADDTLPPTDCRVEWADGGAERRFERLSALIETEFAKAIDAMENSINPRKPS